MVRITVRRVLNVERCGADPEGVKSHSLDVVQFADYRLPVAPTVLFVRDIAWRIGRRWREAVGQDPAISIGWDIRSGSLVDGTRAPVVHRGGLGGAEHPQEGKERREWGHGGWKESVRVVIRSI